MKKFLSILLLVVILSGVAGNQAFASEDKVPKLFGTTSVPINF
ncbi:hypothetical protein [Sporosarcina beigongshangi]|nr:hypothetical protein [Sporosarcina beigongshangi]